MCVVNQIFANNLSCFSFKCYYYLGSLLCIMMEYIAKVNINLTECKQFIKGRFNICVLYESQSNTPSKLSIFSSTSVCSIASSSNGKSQNHWGNRNSSVGYATLVNPNGLGLIYILRFSYRQQFFDYTVTIHFTQIVIVDCRTNMTGHVCTTCLTVSFKITIHC
jgi:hypothetical protein